MRPRHPLIVTCMYRSRCTCLCVVSIKQPEKAVLYKSTPAAARCTNRDRPALPALSEPSSRPVPRRLVASAAEWGLVRSARLHHREPINDAEPA